MMRRLSAAVKWMGATPLGVLVALTACGSRASIAPSDTAAITSPSIVAVVPTSDANTAAPSTSPAAERHVDHTTLATALPALGELTFLPNGTTTSDDSDLTSKLVTPSCSGGSTPVPSNRDAATNRGYYLTGQPIAEVTLYDVDSADEARAFTTGMRDVIACSSTTPGGLQIHTVTIADTIATGCDEAIVVREEQPVSETVDGWCRVANLVSWVRLYPTGPNLSDGSQTIGSSGVGVPPGEFITPPTDEHAVQLITVVGGRLRSLVDG